MEYGVKARRCRGHGQLNNKFGRRQTHKQERQQEQREVVRDLVEAMDVLWNRWFPFLGPSDFGGGDCRL